MCIRDSGDVLAVENVVVFDLKEEKKACRDEASSSPNQEENRYQTDTKPIPIFSGSNTSKIEDQKRRKTPKNDEKHPKTTNPTLSRLQRFGIAFSLSVVILQNYDEERVNEVLSVASAKNYGAGWIIKALREKWVLSGQQAAGTGSGRLLSYAEMLDYCNKNGLIGTGKQSKITDYFEAVRVSGQEKPLWKMKAGASSTMNSTPSPINPNSSHHTGATQEENTKGLRLAYSRNGGLEGKYEA